MRALKFLAVLALAVGGSAKADDYQAIPEDRIESIAKDLAEAAGKVKDAPSKIQLDAAKARGLFDAGAGRGLMVVPGKDLKENRDDPDLTKEKGRAIGGIFFLNVLPSGAANKDKLFKVDHKDQEGSTREIRYAVVTVKKKSDEEWFVQLWGTGKEPLCETQIGEAEGDEKFPMDVSIANAELTIKMLGKYGTKLGIKESQF